jgi:hypothetical protein
MALEIAQQVVLDPLIADVFNVIRRPVAVGTNGRVSNPANVTTVNVPGVVTMYSDAEVIREQFPEIEYATRIISVVCKFMLQTAVSGYQPDLLVWRGDSYLIQKVSPYPQFGSGFYEAVCSSIDLNDQQFLPAQPGGFVFNLAANAAYEVR